MLWITVGAAAAGFGAMIALPSSAGANVLIVILGLLAFGAIGWSMRTDADGSWLAKWVLWGFLAKLVGAWGRHWMVVVLYGTGDSLRYHRVGVELAQEWRSGTIPDLTGLGAFGTQVSESITGGLFAIFTPDLLGGFLMFSILAYLGQLMMYAAFRHWAEPHQLKPFAFLIFFLPSYMFWPSSIGKDAIVVLALGGAAYFAARVLEGFAIRWIPGLVISLGVLGLIRIHVAGLVVVGLTIAGVLARLPENVDPIARIRRFVFIGAGLGAALLVLTVFPDVFGVDLTGGDSVDAFASDVVRRTSEAGTVASGGAVAGPADIPGAIALVLFRPFAFEATELQHFFAAAETSLLLGLTIWKLPAILRNWRSWRRNGYVVFCSFYVLGFAIAFSVVRNLGIIARQRGQVLAFFLVVLIAMGWEEKVVTRPVIPGVRPPARLPS